MTDENSAIVSSDALDFVHDYYGQLNAQLLHTEQLRAQALNLYFVLLCAITALFGAAMTVSSPEFLVSLETVLAGVALFVGSYFFSLLIFYRWTTSLLRFESDRITRRWARDCTVDYRPKLLCDNSSPGGSNGSKVRMWVVQAWRSVPDDLKCDLNCPKKLVANEKDLVLIMVANGVATFMFSNLLTNPVVTAKLPATLDWIPRVTSLVPPVFWAVAVVLAEFLFYFWHDRHLNRKARDLST